MENKTMEDLYAYFDSQLNSPRTTYIVVHPTVFAQLKQRHIDNQEQKIKFLREALYTDASTRYLKTPVWGSGRGTFARGLYVQMVGDTAFAQVLSTRTKLPCRTSGQSNEMYKGLCVWEFAKAVGRETRCLEDKIEQAKAWGDIEKYLTTHLNQNKVSTSHQNEDLTDGRTSNNPIKGIQKTETRLHQPV